MDFSFPEDFPHLFWLMVHIITRNFPPQQKLQPRFISCTSGSVLPGQDLLVIAEVVAKVVGAHEFVAVERALHPQAGT